MLVVFLIATKQLIVLSHAFRVMPKDIIILRSLSFWLPLKVFISGQNVQGGFGPGEHFGGATKNPAHTGGTECLDLCGY